MSSELVLRVENGVQAGQTFPLTAPSVVIGRHSEAGIVLNDSQTSRRHARLDVSGNRATLTDLNSANGTYVNGSRLTAPQQLNPGDLIEVGECRLRLEGPVGATQVAAPRVLADHTATRVVAMPAPDPASIAAGTILNGRYRLERSIGQGGFARVFLASDTALKRPIAVKVMNVELVGEGTIEDFLERFANEAQAIANLDHPHILAIHDFGQIGSAGFLVMPFVAGGTLAEALRARGPFAPHLAARYLRQVAAALDYAHRRNLVHRDIKPQNMLLRAEDDHLLLADFGIAKVISATSAQSRTGVVGTIAYMAPEQFQGQVSRATDIYALGCVLFQMLTGKLPYSGSTEQMIFGHLSAPVPKLADHGADLSSEAQAVVARALAKLPDDRFASAGDLAAAFDAALTATPPRPAPDTPKQAVTARPPRAATLPPWPTSSTPPRPADAPRRQLSKWDEAEEVPQRKPEFKRKPESTLPAPPATSLTTPAVVVAAVALVAVLANTARQLSADMFFPDAPNLARVGTGLALLAIVLIRAAALQRTAPEELTIGKSLLRAQLLVLPSCCVAVLCLSDGALLPYGPAVPAWGIALVLAAVGPLVVPDASATRAVGTALARAAAMAYVAFGIALLALVQLTLMYGGFDFFYDYYDDNDSQLASLTVILCLGGSVVALLMQQGARRFAPRAGSWLWLPALALAAAAVFVL